MVSAESTGRRLETEDVEVTPEMIEAGLDAYYERDPEGRGEATLREAIKAVFRAMLAERGPLRPRGR
jgi:hypothetical protein